MRFHESRFTINGGGVESQVSAALVQNTVERFAPIIDELYATLPPLLEGYRVKILDGNHFSATEHWRSALLLVAYNGISLIKAALRAVFEGQTVENEVSGYYISLKIAQTYTGMMIAIPEENWRIFGDLAATQMVVLLKELAKHVVLSKYQKHPRGPKKPRPQRTKMSEGNHVSTARILARRNLIH